MAAVLNGLQNVGNLENNIYYYFGVGIGILFIIWGIYLVIYDYNHRDDKGKDERMDWTTPLILGGIGVAVIFITSELFKLASSSTTFQQLEGAEVISKMF